MKKLIKTDRIHLVFALNEIIDELPFSGTIEEWCVLAEHAYKKLGTITYCHKSEQSSLLKHAEKYGEIERFKNAKYHCDLQHDIAKLNRDTNAPSGTNSDPLFPQDTNWIFYNDGSQKVKSISNNQLLLNYDRWSDINIDFNNMISSDGHKCLSQPELLIEKFFIDNNIKHFKEGDLDEHKNKITNYPFDPILNKHNNSKKTDWVLPYDKGLKFVEYFEGKQNQEKYLEKVEIKRKLSSKYNIDLIEIWRKDLTTKTLMKKFKEFI